MGYHQQPYVKKTALRWVIRETWQGIGSSMEVEFPQQLLMRVRWKNVEKRSTKLKMIVENSAALKYGCYSLKVPLKKEIMSLPTNFLVIKQRILGLNRKFVSNEKFYGTHLISTGQQFHVHVAGDKKHH